MPWLVDTNVLLDDQTNAAIADEQMLHRRYDVGGMKPLVGLIATLLIVAACATPSPTPSPSSTANVSPTVVPTPTPDPSSQVSCGDFPTGDCEAAIAAVLMLNEELLVAGSHRTAIRIELGRGIYCPLGPAFETTTCPAGAMPPAIGGVWIGHALVTYAGTSFQGFVDVAKDGQTIRGTITGVATPPPPTSSPS